MSETVTAPQGNVRSAPARTEEKAPVRRVGSVTLGLCLIAAGIFFLCYHFWAGFDAQLVLKIAPAVGLCALGAEVLIFAAKPERWKYDFMSVFVCLVLMACCFGLSVLPQVWDEFGPQRTEVSERLSDEYTDAAYAALTRSAPDIRLRDVRGHIGLSSSTAAETLDDVAALTESEADRSLTVELRGPYADKAAFAADCRALTDALLALKLPPYHVTFTCASGGEPDYWSLSLAGDAQLHWTAEEMAQEAEGTSDSPASGNADDEADAASEAVAEAPDASVTVTYTETAARKHKFFSF